MTQRTEQQNKEKWKVIPGYEGLYEISSLGRIKSLPRLRSGKTHNSKSEFYFMTKEKILKPQVGGTGYYKISLYKNGIHKNHNLHRLIAEAFIPNPDNLPQVNHKDGNKKNYSLDNLEWCTLSENMRHAYDVIGIQNYFEGKYGKEHSKSKSIIQKEWVRLRQTGLHNENMASL